jgi:ABC-type nitrate/sulfonate/bicarbonate transport system permease component
MCVFDILVTVSAGARNVERNLIDVGRAFGAGRWQLFRKVLLPASLPFLFTALRIGLVRAVIALITAELFFAAVNLGKYMQAAQNRFDSAGLLAVLTILAVVGLLAQEGLKALEGQLLPWHVRR